MLGRVRIAPIRFRGIAVVKKYRARHALIGRLLPLLFIACVLSAAEPTTAPTPTTAPAPVSGPAPTSGSAPAATPAEQQSAWLASFPPAQRRSLASGPAQQAVILWLPEMPWRGDIVLLPGASNAAHFNGPLLSLPARLAQAGWRCLLLAREPNRTSSTADSTLTAATEPQPTMAAPATTIGRATPTTQTELQALLNVLAAEPVPTERAENATTQAPLFLLTQADSGELAWAEAVAADSRFAGIVMLGTEQLPEALRNQAPVRPLLELQFRQQGRHVANAAQSRQQRWQQLPTYQQQTLIASPATPIDRWLGNTIDGWLRKISLQQPAATDDSLKRQMTAQSAGSSKPASP